METTPSDTLSKTPDYKRVVSDESDNIDKFNKINIINKYMSQIDDNFINAYIYRAFLHVELGNFELRTTDRNTIIKLDPENRTNYMSKVYDYYSNEKGSERHHQMLLAKLNESLVEKVDSYLNYVVENWISENEIAIEQGLRTEIAEQFMDSLQSVFKEHYIEVPEGKANLIDDLADQVAELEEQLNKTTEDNIQLHEKAQSFERANIVRKQSSGLAVTEAERLASLVEDIDFDDADTFEMKVKTIKDSYFEKEVSESVDEADALVGEEEPLVESSNTMNAYTQAISKHIK